MRSRWPRAGAGVLPRVGDGVGDALRRRRVRRQEVRRARVDAGALRAQMRVHAHRGEEALGAVGVVAGARRDADADAVGLELLGAREVGQRDLRFGERERAELRIAEQVGGDAVDQRGLARLVLADFGVAGDHMRHLVRQHRGELGVVVGERDQAAGDVELAVRQREGVDRGRVEDGDFVFQLRPLGRHDQLVDGLLQHLLHARARDRRRHTRQGCGGARAAPTPTAASASPAAGWGVRRRSSACSPWNRRRASVHSAVLSAIRRERAASSRPNTACSRLIHDRAPRSRSARDAPPRSTGRRAPRSNPAP